MSIYLVNQILAIGTIFGQILIIWAIFHFCFYRKKDNFLSKFISQNGLLLAFIVALSSVFFSLFYSEFIGYEPCALCWYQRIFIYPQVVLLGIAMFKKDYGVIKYSISLSIIGGLLAGYHYFLQLGLISGLPCPAVGTSLSCSKLLVNQFGYITIPMMSLTAFSMIIVFLLFYKLEKSKKLN